MPERGSRIPGFHERGVAERARLLSTRLEDPALSALLGGQTLSLEIAERLSENVVAVMGMPLSVATNFLINGEEVLVPMSVEEPSVVAAASFGAKLVREGGGFLASSDNGEMIGQIELRGLPDVAEAAARLREAEPELLALVNQLHPRLVARGGGARAISFRPLEPSEGHAVCELVIDCQEAMGANLINTSCEALAEPVSRLVGGSVGLRILSNFCDRRRARASCAIPLKSIGRAVGEGIAQASLFADRDLWRAVTHNKGFMNGVDALVVATGNDWRAVESAAHAFAARGGSYQPLSRWWIDGEFLRGETELPLALGTVGGATEAHPGARLAMAILGRPSSRRLSEIAAAVGLAQNLSALRALAGEGIQKGHMALHARRVSAPEKKISEERFLRWLAPRASQVDTALEQFFAKRAASLDAGERGAPGELRPALDALREFSLRGGKRLRAVLGLLGYELAQGQAPDSAVTEACLSLEFLHVAFLAQEDLISGALTRRGGASLQFALGEAGARRAGLSRGESRALVVSDLAQSYAMEALLHAALPGERRIAAAGLLLSLSREVLGGEWRDLTFDPRSANEAEVLHIYELRAGRYAAFGPLAVGAALGGAAREMVESLAPYARALGLAFALRAEVLDLFGTPGEGGRGPGDALRVDRAGLLWVEALRRANPEQAARLRALFSAPGKAQSEAGLVRDLLEETGARAAVEARAVAFAEEAQRVLPQEPFGESARALLLDLAEYAADRHR
jgi:hydroxymethylglutaryl-CoA reductase